jgi:hypothetical protein
MAATAQGLMDSARHVIKHIYDHRVFYDVASTIHQTSVTQRSLRALFLSVMTSYDVASTLHQSPFIERAINPRFSNEMASYDVASNIHRSLPGR